MAICGLGIFLIPFLMFSQLVSTPVAYAFSTSTEDDNDNDDKYCVKHPINSITADGGRQSAGHPPEYAIDNNLKTRWSMYGLGSWIKPDLGEQMTICSVDIAWYKGNLRQYNFAISVSNDGTSFTKVFSGKSSGTTSSFETYSLPSDTNGRYVRITINGNTDDNWANIIELNVNGFGSEANSASVANGNNEPTDVAIGDTPMIIPFDAGISSHTPALTAAATTTCQKLSISKITANGDDGNHPANTIDNNLNTRWSNLGKGSWIQVDLGSKMTICSVDIAWYKGNLRQYNFAISVSNDSSTFTNVFTGKSSGNTLSPENYDFPDVTSRYVRITVNGNTQNNWASITELVVNGFSSTTSPPPPASCTVDKFGIKEIYCTKSGGEEWFMNMDNPKSDSRLSTRSVIYKSSLTRNPDGSWKITNPPDQSRFYIYTSSGYHQDLISTYNEATLASKGYMQSPNDWKNVEISGYVKLNAYSDVDHAFVWYNRGGFHSTSYKCEGTAYKGNINYVGKTRFQKEQWHPSYFTTSWKQATSSDPKDRWIGFKYVVYNFQLNGKLAVKMENWLDDKANGNWVKIDEHVDSGGWGTTGTDCGGSPDQLIVWGGPVATFRFDAITNLDFKNFSVREIQPPQ